MQRGSTYGKFTNLGIVHTKDFFLFRDAQVQTGDQIDDEENDAASEERVGHTGDGVRQLVAELDVVVIDPASVNDRGTIEVGDVVTITREQALVECPPVYGYFIRIRGPYAAKRPVKRLPTRPPMACTAKISSASSTRSTYLSLVA